MFASVQSHLWVHAGLLIYSVLLHPAAAIIGETSDRTYVRAEQLPKRRGGYVLLNGVAEHKPRCSKENYATGSWVFAPSAKQNYLCCSIDGDHFRAGSQFCRGMMSIQDGLIGKRHLMSTVEERTIQHSWPYFKFVPFSGHACACQRTPSKPDQMLDIEKYEWKPSACALEPFDAMTFCDRLKGRMLAVIGDSTAQQAGASLINMVIGGMPSDGIGCAPQIKVVLSDTLVNANVTPPERGLKDLKDIHVWLSRQADTTESEDPRATEITNLLVNVTAAVDHGLDLVVLGSGAHFHSRETYYKMLEKVADSITTRRKKPNPPQFLWKTISGAGCGQINEEFNASKYSKRDYTANKYSWNDFKKYDNAARKKMREVNVPIVDMDMMYLRGDGHHDDCLHFCAPGPLDVFAQVLSHMLS